MSKFRQGRGVRAPCATGTSTTGATATTGAFLEAWMERQAEREEDICGDVMSEEDENGRVD